MKVLMALHNYPPEFTGGVERSVVVLARELVKRGHELRILAGSERRRPVAQLEQEEHEGILVHRFHRAEGYINPVDLHDPLADAAVENLLAGFRPDLVHVHHWYGLTTGLVGLAARAGIPAAVTLHDYWTSCALFFRMPDDERFCAVPEGLAACQECLMIRRPMEEGEMRFGLEMRFADLDQELALARALIVSTQRQLVKLGELGRFPRSVFHKVRLEPLGVLHGRPNRSRPVPDRRDQPVTFSHWGNLSRLKGVLDLVRAAAGSPLASRIRLHFAGASVEAGLENEMRRLAGPVELRFTGPYEPERLSEILAETDVAVFPSRAMETHSLVVDEALMLGLPVVVSDVGAMAERVGGRGRVVPAGDVEALRKVLEELVPREGREGLAAGEPGHLVTGEEYAGMIERIYEDVVAEGAPPAGRDLARDRLAFRNARLAEIARFVGSLLERKTMLEEAIRGDRAALVALTAADPELAIRLGGADQEEKDA
ncbi:MAG: glycosyltransferase [Planctomycetes bacterium]|nr:glycosyltransferase [Planctomycetota bacterium]